jgi:hypothetical protein
VATKGNQYKYLADVCTVADIRIQIQMPLGSRQLKLQLAREFSQVTIKSKVAEQALS